jgi:hypothetical protein
MPAGEVDHINGVRADNRIANLRLATMSQNRANAKRRSDNRSGLKGVSWCAPRSKWRAQIKTGGRSQHLGLFGSAEAAHAAYSREATRVFGEYARLA